MANTGTKIVASAAAAATLGVGTLLYNQWTPQVTDDDVAATLAVIDDVKPILVELPSVGVPTITVDSLVTRVEPISPPVAVYSVGEVQTPEPAQPVVAQVSIAPVNVMSPAVDIPRIQHLHKTWEGIVKDKRQLVHDKGISIHNEGLEKWLAIYEQPLPPSLETLLLPKGVKMIAELRTLDHAAENLAFYRRMGYNACLVPVYGDEKPLDIVTLVQAVKQAKLKAWIAWAGPEALSWTIYRDPDQITRTLAMAAPMCEGYICAWRRTSAHLVMQDLPYIEHLAAAVRAANPGIYVVGESYFGETWENTPGEGQDSWTARDNAPRNPSAVLINGIATQGWDIEKRLLTTFGRWLGTPKLGVVLGSTPYYASRNDTGQSFYANFRIKRELEQRFRRAGCHGTITIHGDASNLGTSLQTVDDIGKYKIE